MSNNQAVYLDYAATTPTDPRVAEKMMAYLTPDGVFGNPASRSHGYGWQAEEAVENARQQVADLVNADPREIVWTSGATESDNLAIKGVAQFYGSDNNSKGKHIISSKIEHKAVLDPLRELEAEGFEITLLDPEPGTGIISPESVKAALREDTLLVSLMMVNNELGTITDVAAIGEITREAGVLFHVDAAQATGKVAIDLATMKIDLMSFSAHKTYGPKGVGALYVRRKPRVRIKALIHGGGHERGMRSGTLPTHQIVGMGEAFEIAKQIYDQDKGRIDSLSRKLLSSLQSIDSITLNGHATQRVSNILNLCFSGIENEDLMMTLPNLAVSSGSSCNSKTVAPSYVLRGIGLTDAQAHSSLRFSMGRYTTDADIDTAIISIHEAVNKLKKP